MILEAPKQESANNIRNNYGRTENPPLFHTQADFGNTNDKEIEFNYVIENKNLILEVPNTKSSKAEGFQGSPNVEEDKTSSKVRLHILDIFFHKLMSFHNELKHVKKSILIGQCVCL